MEVSIIIPTYNRFSLLGATLDSILAQTYKDWECVVVDDGSTDYTKELMEFYCSNDFRIQFHRRPKKRIKGANVCRNYGFEKSSGKYIQWFDSDDLMVPEFLEEKVKALEENGVDYVISKTVNFIDPDPNQIISRNEAYYQFDKYAITNFNYVSQKINWLTYDFMGKRKDVEKVRFNERLGSAQERNFFSKLTCYSVNAMVIDQYLTFRRIHDSSTQFKVNSNENLRHQEHTNFLYQTWLDISDIKPGTDEEFYFIVRLLNLDQRYPFFPKNLLKILGSLLLQMRIKKFFYLIFYRIVFTTTGGGFFIRRRLKKCE